MTHPPDSTESAKARANEPAPRGEVMYLERIGWRRLSEAEYADPDRRAEMMRDAKQAVDVLNRLSSGAPSPRILAEAARELGCSIKTKPEPSSGAEGARKPRKPTLANVAKQVSKAGIDVSRYEVKPDSTIVIVTGQGESIEPNPWLDDLKVTKQ
jgi:hypothetical protein